MREDNSINIRLEQQKIRTKLSKVKSSNLFHHLINSLSNFKDTSIDPLQEKNINIHGRLKKVTSAIDKIAQKRITADELYDLIAFMFVVDLPENYEQIKQILINTLPGVTYTHLFDGALPENNGYSSLHLGIDVKTFFNEYGISTDSDLEGLSAEIQLKTYGMYMAQEATHDSIYKNNNLSYKQKCEMQSLMFPLIELLTDIEMYKKKLYATVDENSRKDIQEKISSLKKEIVEYNTKNSNYINSNISLVDEVFKEYIARKHVEILKQHISSELTFEETESLLSTFRNAIEYLSGFQEPEELCYTEPTGLRNIDVLLHKFDRKTIEEVEILSMKNRSKKNTIFFQNILNATKDSVTTQNMSDTLDTLQEHLEMENEKSDGNVEK